MESQTGFHLLANAGADAERVEPYSQSTVPERGDERAGDGAVIAGMHDIHVVAVHDA
jgi:hypothetical protein